MNIAMVFLAAVQLAVFLVWAWTLGVVIAGIHRGRQTKKAEKDSRHKFRFAVLICAHNEGNVIAGLLESLKAQSYPSDCWKTFLIADRCTDHTCDIAQQYDFVTVLCREEQGESRKGLALKWGIEQVLEKEQGTIDAIMVLDADNQVIPEFLELFNEKFLQGSLLVTGRRVAMNPYQTLVSKWYAVYWSMVTDLFCYSRSRLGLSSLLSGTGFAFSVSILGEEGFSTLSMSEDIEFSVQQNLKGICVDYQEKAVYYDEQPTSVKVMFRQLRRWTTGGYQIVGHYAGKMAKKFCQKPSLMLWDSFISLLLCGNMGMVFAAGIGNACIGAVNGGFWAVYAFLMGTLTSAVLFAVGLTAVRRSSLKARNMLDGILLFPVFCMLLSCVSLYSFFRPQTKWYKIEHYGNGGADREREGEKVK